MKSTGIKTYPLPTATTTAKAVILADGDYPAPDSIAGGILRSARYIVCCDGAADDYIRSGRIPAAIVGDCDSLSRDIVERYPDLIHRIDDTETNDLTKAFRFCLSRGIDDMIILGATGRREDHTLANIGLLTDYVATEGVARLCMITDNGIFDAISADSRFESFEGQQVSLFTIDPSVRVRAEGLRYPLPPNFRSWWSGSLNQAEQDAIIVYTNGKTLIFRAIDRYMPAVGM